MIQRIRPNRTADYRLDPCNWDDSAAQDPTFLTDGRVSLLLLFCPDSRV